MANNEVGKLTLTVDNAALRQAIADGRLLELADKLASQAAAQISAQIVDRVAKAALEPKALEAGVSASFSYVLEGGDYGTVPPRPHFGVVNIESLPEVSIRQVLVAAGAAQRA